MQSAAFFDLEIQPNGQPVAHGKWTNFGYGGGFVLARFNTHGTLDTTFGGTGFINPIVSGEVIPTSAMALQTEDEDELTGACPIVVGFSGPGPGLNGGTVEGIWLQRYDTEGNLDLSF